MTDALLVGSTLALLVAAADLGEAGATVVLATDGRPPGGHFRGLTVEGVDFDIGMVTLEHAGTAAAAGEAPDLRTYDADRRYDWTRFAALVDRWQDEHATPRPVPTPQVLVEGRRWPDHLMSDRLEVVGALGVPPEDPLDRSDPGHASAKTRGARYDGLGYLEAARLNHGEQLQQRLVAPFLDKVLGAHAPELLARYHRAAWVPLYWPETVAAACAGEPTGVAEHPFWTTSTGFVGDVVRGLERRLAALPSVTVDTRPLTSLDRSGGTWRLRTSAGGEWVHPTPVLGLPWSRTAELTGVAPPAPGPAVPIVLASCLVRAGAVGDPVACLAVTDPGLLTHRLTDQDLMAGREPGWRRVVVEAGHAAEARAAAGEDLARVLAAELAELLDVRRVGGLPSPDDVRVLRVLRAPTALPVPTAGVVAGDRAARERLVSACQGVVPTGALLGTGLNSWSDQLVQGLAVAGRLG